MAPAAKATLRDLLTILIPLSLAVGVENQHHFARHSPDEIWVQQKPARISDF
jgi:hypothetical protein